jgi:hypothetical protein
MIVKVELVCILCMNNFECDYVSENFKLEAVLLTRWRILLETLPRDRKKLLLVL